MKEKLVDQKTRRDLIYNKDLDQYTGKVLFEKKVERANEILKKVGVPKDIKQN